MSKAFNGLYFLHISATSRVIRNEIALDYHSFWDFIL